jgi:hypothetical protein
MNKPFRPAATYAADPHAWAAEQAALLRARRFDALDIDHIAEEIESVGRSERRSLVSALRVLLTHMLKWDAQPERRGRSWANTIRGQRVKARQALRDNPSLKPVLPEAVADAYERARLAASAETDLPLAGFPETCPYDAAAIFDREFDID